MNPARPADTDARSQRAQDRLYQAMTGAERVAIALRLSDSVRRLAAAGIRRRHPDYADDDVRMALVRLVHGDDVARALWPDHDLVAP